jgi:hypothetical protein
MATQTRKSGGPGKKAKGAAFGDYGGVGGMLGGAAPGRRGPQRPAMPGVGPGMLPDGMGGPDPLGEMMMPGMDPVTKIADAVERWQTRAPIERLRLVQKTASGDSAVAEFDREELAELGDSTGVAEAIYERAVDDVNGMGSLGRFAVLCYQAGRGAQTSRCFFRLSPEDQDGLIDSENPATESGHLSQAWRHTEAATKFMLNALSDCTRTMATELRRISDQNIEYANRHTELLIAQQELLDRKALRDITIRKAESEQKRAEKRKTQIETLTLWGASELAARHGLQIPAPIMLALLGPEVAGAMAAGNGAPRQLNGAPGHPQQAPGTTGADLVRALSPDDVTCLMRVAVATLNVLCETKEGVLEFLLGRLPEADQATIRGARAASMERTQRSRRGESPVGSPQERSVMADYQLLVCRMLAGGVLDEATLAALISQLPPGAQDDARRVREALKTKAPQATAPTPASDGSNGGGQPPPAPAAATPPQSGAT